ncbi:expressed unknown protein [Seminavis robusta]|uniref:Uncharacterized protein n=1 Tax=Seminavis robusta TaxID=568900 RepID=A0A9N8EFV4_9STRA|nr:expressed unknown protein [Seminavis robusta]|eukprot:Sro1095_g240700.1 n/a (371) ;mRNA; r:25099-26211
MWLYAYQCVILPLIGEAIQSEWQKSEKSPVMAPQSSKMADESRKEGIVEEEVIRRASLSCLEFWAGAKERKRDENGGLVDKKQDDTTSIVSASIDKECLVTSLSQGKTASIQGAKFDFSTMVGSEGNERRETSSLYQDEAGLPDSSSMSHDAKVLSVKILPVGPQNAASVQVVVEISRQNDIVEKPTILATIHGFLTLLKSSNHRTCISAAFSTNTGTILPEHFNAVTKLTWEGYCGANRARDGAAMAKVFHPSCRLTYVQDDSMVAVVPQPAFCAKVQHRYTKETMHQPYAPLQAHPNIGMHDTLQDVEFATPDCCMVTLKVGHPPCLWSDLLTCCYLGSDQGWWIMHKSSCHEEFMLTDDMKALLGAS